MAAEAGAAREHGLAALRESPRSRPGRPRQLHRRPAPEPGIRIDHDAESHVGVRLATEFGALPSVVAHRVRTEGDPVDAAGNGVPLAAQRRRPERVDDVGGGDGQLHGPAAGKWSSVGGANGSPGERNSHHHWLPIPSTFRASARTSPEVAKITTTVGTGTNKKMNGGASSQA